MMECVLLTISSVRFFSIPVSVLFSECVNLWQHLASRGSNDLCYSHFNVMGVGFGHCRSNGANFISCPIQ